MNVIKHDPEQKITEGWHLDKRISLAHILTTIAMTLALAAWMWALSERIVVTEQDIIKQKEINDVEHSSMRVQIATVKQRDIELMNEWVRQNSEILRRLERIEDGVNRHIGNEHE